MTEEEKAQKVGKCIVSLDETLRENYKLSIEIRAEALKRAVEDGWFSKFLLGAGVVASGLLAYGLINDNETAQYMGLGALSMDSLYGILLYGDKIFNIKREAKKD